MLQRRTATNYGAHLAWGVLPTLRSLFVHIIGRFTLFILHILTNFARSYRIRISQITYSHFHISQNTNARNNSELLGTNIGATGEVHHPALLHKV